MTFPPVLSLLRGKPKLFCPSVLPNLKKSWICFQLQPFFSPGAHRPRTNVLVCPCARFTKQACFFSGDGFFFQALDHSSQIQSCLTPITVAVRKISLQRSPQFISVGKTYCGEVRVKCGEDREWDSSNFTGQIYQPVLPSQSTCLHAWDRKFHRHSLPKVLPQQLIHLLLVCQTVAYIPLL